MISWPPGLSATILATLGLLLAGSIAIFNLLGRRVTLQRRELAVKQWAADQGAEIVEPGEGGAVPRLEFLGAYHPAARQVMVSPRWTLAELTTDAPAEAKGQIPRWRLLAVQTNASPPWPGTGLRPVAHAVSLLDLTNLSSFPSLTGGDRFVVFGTEQAAAQALADSPAQTLLPPDLGLLLHGTSLIVDFSTRRFETIEFERLIQLADQLATHLIVEMAKSGS